MSSSDLNRRDFHRLSVAAMGGLMAGAAAGCGEQPAAKSTAESKAKDEGAKATEAAKSESAKSESAGTAVAMSEKHTCRGLNTCKGLGGGATVGKNSCAGQGECATVAKHSCGPSNECKGQGGCGKDPGNNECKGQGGCKVPLMDFAWEKVRARFEEKMKAAGKTFSDAPAVK